uniref:FGGY_N domain-containing protein n=1 Tax=Bursaphelenchus xylophilus TaxID=6326 RepID=A0A1I7SUH2_BURXY
MMKTYLGIDIGTTNLKVGIVNGEGEVVYEESSTHNAHVNTTFNHDEQDPRKILTDLESIFKRNKHFLHEVEGITVTGQMHGILFWDSTADVWDGKDKESTSNLITWMDQRCDESFLHSLPLWENETGAKESNVSTGYGLATLIWLHKHGLINKRWDRCGTIMDFVVFSLGVKEYFISDQLAFSWGYMTNKGEWQKNILSLIYPLALPEIKPSGTIYRCQDLRVCRRSASQYVWICHRTDSR